MKVRPTKRRIKKWTRAYWQWQRLAVLRGESWFGKHAKRLLFLQDRVADLTDNKTKDGWQFS